MPMAELPERLLAGYRNFIHGRFAAETERYRELAREGQRPDTMIIACCDSRAAPETIFDCGPGELFVVRNVANLVPPYAPDDRLHGTSAALEFAVQNLKVKTIVVLGHGRCGGINAVLNPADEPLSPGDFIGQWMGLVAPAAATLPEADTLEPAARQTALERASIRFQLANLRSFPCVRILEDRGRLALCGAWFDIGTGELWVMDDASGAFHRAAA